MFDFRSLALLTTLLGSSISYVSAANDLKITWGANDLLFDGNAQIDQSTPLGGKEFHQQIEGDRTFQWQVSEGPYFSQSQALWEIEFVAQVVKPDYDGTAEFVLDSGSSDYVKIVDSKDGSVVLKSTKLKCYKPELCGPHIDVSFDTSTQ